MGCKSQQAEEKKIMEQLPEPAFEQIATGNHAHYNFNGIHLISNDESLKRWYLAIYGEFYLTDNDLPAIDWKNESIVFHMLGTRTTGGFGSRGDKLTAQGNRVTFYLSETSPAAGEMVTMAITHPYAIYKINRPAGMVTIAPESVPR